MTNNDFCNIKTIFPSGTSKLVFIFALLDVTEGQTNKYKQYP